MCTKVVGLVSLVFVLLGILTSVAAAADAVPVGWWKLDGNAEDSSGNNNHGTLAGNPTWVAGKYGGALDLDGADDHVTCGTGPSLNITGPMTISAWVYLGGPGGGTLPRIVDKSNGTGGADPGYKLYVRPTSYVFTLSAGGAYFNSTLALKLNTWSYVAFVITGTQWKLCVNDAWERWSRTELPTASTRPLVIGDSPSGGRTFDGLFDDVRIYNKALTEDEILEVKKGPAPADVASKPVPGDKAVDVPADVTLSWKPAKDVAAANGHVVYLSKNFTDVNDGVGGVKQNDSRYAPGRLDFGTTYYWRVDEVGTAPGAAARKGEVWSFTVEPYAYPVRPVTATASSAQPNMGPEKTIDGSGLGADDRHSVEPVNMWLSLGTQPNWIQYKFDRVCKLYELWVWNSNQMIESSVGFGAKTVTIEYSLDGSTWKTLAGVPEFARAPGTAGYTHNTTVSFGGVLAQYVRLTITANWGGIPQTGLSEVRFFVIPLQAREPAPADTAAGVGLDAVLNWRPGREAASHKVYLGKDKDAVAQGTAPAATVAEHSFTPPALDLGATYYWRVDEVNQARTPSVYEGAVWSFSTLKYTVVDDFENYTDDEGSRIYEAWIDGYGTTTNGSQVGNTTAPFAEQKVVHGDKQSMPLAYSNKTASSSEAERTLSPAQDWTAGGVKTLSLWLYGDPNNAGAQIYVKVNGAKVVYDGDAGDLAMPGWRPWNISLTSFGTNLQKVTKLAIGIDGKGSGGKFFFDDIRLYPRERQFITPTEPNTTGLVAYYKLDKDGADSSGNKNDGTVRGNPPWVAGKVGNAVKLDGGHDYIDCGKGPTLDLKGPMTVVAWMQPTGAGSGGYGRLLDKSSGSGATDPGYKFYHRAAEKYIMTLSVGGGDHRSTSGLVLNTWNFFGFVATGTQWKLCLNGAWEEWNEKALPTVVTNPLYLGNASTIERYFQGLLDEIRIYNRVLTPGEIAWLSGRTKPFDLPL